jgi:archaellum component FlaC
MPDTVQKFSDIKLRDYSKNPGCQPPTSALKGKYTLNKKDELFVKYADNIKKMIQSAADNQYKLLDIINELFTYVNDPYSGKRVIRINPKLTDESLQKAVEKTRKYIVNLYVKCENDYITGVQLFEAIVESKIVETTEKQIENLKKEADKIIKETKKASQPVKQNEPPVVVAEPNTTISSISTPSNIPTISTTSTTSTMPTTSTTNTTSILPIPTNTLLQPISAGQTIVSNETPTV